MPTAVDHGARTSAGILAKQSPESRREKARRARATQSTPEHAARRLVESWPALTEAKRAELRALLSGAGVLDSEGAQAA